MKFSKIKDEAKKPPLNEVGQEMVSRQKEANMAVADVLRKYNCTLEVRQDIMVVPLPKKEDQKKAK